MRVRTAAVAGMFYPNDRPSLSHMVANLLKQAAAEGAHQLESLRGLIVPHAGLVYSGLTAAFAYAAIPRSRFTRALIIGPSHRVPCMGIVVPDYDAFETPLGMVPVDQDAAHRAVTEDGCLMENPQHVLEHSVEVQLPFLQTVAESISIVPAVFAESEAWQVRELLELWAEDPDTLMIISSDLSHYHPYSGARTMDEKTIQQILHLNDALKSQQACGATAINGMIQLAKRHHMTMQLLDYRNSGDTAGDRRRVVGYAAIAVLDDRHCP